MGKSLIQALYSYPVKSFAGVAHDSSEVGRRGLRGDRRFMVVDEHSVFMSQRKVPRMALIHADCVADAIRLSTPGVTDLQVSTSGHGSPVVMVTVWRSECEAVDQGDEAAAWLSRVLEQPCRLVCMHDDWVRPVNPSTAASPDDQVGFADGYPVLLCHEASLRDLNSRMDKAIPMNRFRPNIVMRGDTEAWSEDAWKRIRIGEMEFHVVSQCTRCTITTTDQLTAEQGIEPLKTLATFRKTDSGAVAFGVYLTPVTTGVISVGDELQVLA